MIADIAIGSVFQYHAHLVEFGLAEPFAQFLDRKVQRAIAIDCNGKKTVKGVIRVKREHYGSAGLGQSSAAT